MSNALSKPVPPTPLRRAPGFRWVDQDGNDIAVSPETPLPPPALPDVKQPAAAPSVVVPISLSDAAAELRAEILRERNRSYHGRLLLDSKHFYAWSAPYIPTRTEVSTALCQPQFGTLSNQRLGNAVRVHKVRIKGSVFLSSPINPTVIQAPVSLHFLIIRVKVPQVPGTAPTFHGTDTNPPLSNTLQLFSFNNANDQVSQLLHRNPITEQECHIYKYEKLLLNPRCSVPTDFATGRSVALPEQWDFEHEIDCHGFVQSYGAAVSGANTNELYFSVWGNVDYVTAGPVYPYGARPLVCWSADTVFSDTVA